MQPLLYLSIQQSSGRMLPRYLKCGRMASGESGMGKIGVGFGGSADDWQRSSVFELLTDRVPFYWRLSPRLSHRPAVHLVCVPQGHHHLHSGVPVTVQSGASLQRDDLLMLKPSSSPAATCALTCVLSSVHRMHFFRCRLHVFPGAKAQQWLCGSGPCWCCRGVVYWQEKTDAQGCSSVHHRG